MSFLTARQLQEARLKSMTIGPQPDDVVTLATAQPADSWVVGIIITICLVAVIYCWVKRVRGESNG